MRFFPPEIGSSLDLTFLNGDRTAAEIAQFVRENYDETPMQPNETAYLVLILFKILKWGSDTSDLAPPPSLIHTFHLPCLALLQVALGDYSSYLYAFGYGFTGSWDEITSPESPQLSAQNERRRLFEDGSIEEKRNGLLSGPMMMFDVLSNVLEKIGSSPLPELRDYDKQAVGDLGRDSLKALDAPFSSENVNNWIFSSSDGYNNLNEKLPHSEAYYLLQAVQDLQALARSSNKSFESLDPFPIPSTLDVYICAINDIVGSIGHILCRWVKDSNELLLALATSTPSTIRLARALSNAVSICLVLERLQVRLRGGESAPSESTATVAGPFDAKSRRQNRYALERNRRRVRDALVSALYPQSSEAASQKRMNAPAPPAAESFEWWERSMSEAESHDGPYDVLDFLREMLSRTGSLGAKRLGEFYSVWGVPSLLIGVRCARMPSSAQSSSDSDEDEGENYRVDLGDRVLAHAKHMLKRLSSMAEAGSKVLKDEQTDENAQWDALISDSFFPWSAESRALQASCSAVLRAIEGGEIVQKLQRLRSLQPNSLSAEGGIERIASSVNSLLEGARTHSARENAFRLLDGAPSMLLKVLNNPKCRPEAYSATSSFLGSFCAAADSLAWLLLDQGRVSTEEEGKDEPNSVSLVIVDLLNHLDGLSQIPSFFDPMLLSKVKNPQRGMPSQRFFKLDGPTTAKRNPFPALVETGAVSGAVEAEAQSTSDLLSSSSSTNVPVLTPSSFGPGSSSLPSTHQFGFSGQVEAPPEIEWSFKNPHARFFELWHWDGTFSLYEDLLLGAEDALRLYDAEREGLNQLEFSNRLRSENDAREQVFHEMGKEPESPHSEDVNALAVERIPYSVSTSEALLHALTPSATPSPAALKSAWKGEACTVSKYITLRWPKLLLDVQQELSLASVSRSSAAFAQLAAAGLPLRLLHCLSTLGEPHGGFSRYPSALARTLLFLLKALLILAPAATTAALTPQSLRVYVKKARARAVAAAMRAKPKGNGLVSADEEDLQARDEDAVRAEMDSRFPISVDELTLEHVWLQVKLYLDPQRLQEWFDTFLRFRTLGGIFDSDRRYCHDPATIIQLVGEVEKLLEDSGALSKSSTN